MQFDIDIGSKHKELFHSARKLLLSYDGMVEIKKVRITTYSNNEGGICHLRTMPHGIDFGFLKGVHMHDKYEALSGNGKVMRVLSIQKIDETLVRYYVDQAIKICLQKNEPIRNHQSV